MAMKVTRVDTWAAEMKNQPGQLAGKLDALNKGGANLEFVIARHAADKPGAGVVFVTPISGAAQIRAAKAAGFKKSVSLHTVRVEGTDKAGQGVRICQALATNGLNLHGLSAAAIGRTFVAHVALDTAADAAKAARILRAL